LGDVRTTVWMNTILAIVKGILCFFMISWSGSIGAALASTISVFLVYLVVLRWYAKVNKASAKGLYAIQKDDWLPYLQIIKSVSRRVLRRG
jgi:O-antigen/teichoic acid export membrane protein